MEFLICALKHSDLVQQFGQMLLNDICHAQSWIEFLTVLNQLIWNRYFASNSLNCFFVKVLVVLRANEMQQKFLTSLSKIWNFSKVSFHQCQHFHRFELLSQFL